MSRQLSTPGISCREKRGTNGIKIAKHKPAAPPVKLDVLLTTFGLPKGKIRANSRRPASCLKLYPLELGRKHSCWLAWPPADTPLASRGEAHIQLAGIWNHLLEEHLLVIALAKRPWMGERNKQVGPQGPDATSPTLGPQMSLPISVPALQPPCPSTESRARILKEANGVEPGCVEIIPRNRVTVHVRMWLSAQTRGRQKK